MLQGVAEWVIDSKTCRLIEIGFAYSVVHMQSVAVNERGFRIGEGHPNATLTDAEVDTIRTLHEDYGLSYSTLAEKYEISKGAIAKICRYERRCQCVAKIRRVPVQGCK